MKSSINHFNIISLFFFAASLSVCSNVFNNAGVIIYFIIAFYSLIKLLNEKIKIGKRIRYTYSLFFLPILIAYFFSYFNFLYLNSYEYEYYLIYDMPKRMINCLAFFTIYTYGHICIIKSKNTELEKQLKIFGYGIIIFLGIFGIWQILNMLFGIWIPHIETRTQMHSLSERDTSIANFFRVTSLANEPSYLVPFLLDASLVFLYLKKMIPFYLLIIVLLFSLSLGGYTNAFILLLFSISNFKKFFSSKKIILSSLVIIPLVLFLFYDQIILLIEIVLSRRELSEGFKVTDSGRTEMIFMPWKLLFQGNLLSIFFGNGPGSFKYLSLTQKLSSGAPYHSTSNCLYTDMVYEGGVLAIIGVILFFLCFWGLLVKNSCKENAKEILFGKLFLVHLFISSFYRADFMAPRFWTLVLIIDIMLQIAMIKKEKSSLSYNKN